MKSKQIFKKKGLITNEEISKKSLILSCRFEVAKTALAVLNDNGFADIPFLPLLLFLQTPHYTDFLPINKLSQSLNLIKLKVIINIYYYSTFETLG